MINNKKILAVIPARGGSKGIPRKNIRDLAGKPLIAWTIEAAEKSKYIDKLVVSSEDDEIISVAKSFGCDDPFIRPKDLAQDDTPGIEPILHAVQKIRGYDYVVLLQPTSPLRNVDDIDGCIHKCISQKANACVSVSEAEKSPYWMFRINENDQLSKVLNIENIPNRRQDLDRIYSLNGAIYVAKIDWLNSRKSFLTEETIGFLMPKERSIDIDTELDFQISEYILNKSSNVYKN